MKKIFLFLMLSALLSAQRTELVELKQSIKDKKGTTKSITFIDNRPDKEIGTVIYNKEIVDIKFASEDLKNHIENWFQDDNKIKGNNDIVILLEELNVYNIERENKNSIGKTKIKLSSFIKRNDKYYFLNRINNVFTSEPKLTPNVPKNIANNISSSISGLIKESYTSLPIADAIPEGELMNYENYLNKKIQAYNATELKEGVYKDFKSFCAQKPEFGYYTEKNKKGFVLRVKYRDEIVSNENVFGYVEGGKAYKLTPVGYLEMTKDDKGFFVVATMGELYGANASSGNGVMIGAMAGGIVGALIGAAIDSGSPARRPSNTDTSEMPNVYLDSLTGKYIFD